MISTEGYRPEIYARALRDRANVCWLDKGCHAKAHTLA